MCNVKPAKKKKLAKLLAVRTHSSKRLFGVSFRALLNADYRSVVDRLHDSGQTTAQIMGLTDVDFGWVFKNYCLS